MYMDKFKMLSSDYFIINYVKRTDDKLDYTKWKYHVLLMNHQSSKLWGFTEESGSVRSWWFLYN